MKPLVIYHKDCFDGFTAAWVFRYLKGDADFHPATYGDKPPDCQGREVWIVDFSYKRATLLDIARGARQLRVVDHHKTARADLEELPFCTFDMERSGAGLLWDVLANGVPRPWLVDYVEDRDLWRHARPNSSEVSAWIAAQPMTFEAWDALFQAHLPAAIESGRAVQAYIDQYGRKARAHARIETLFGFEVPTVNMPYMNCSEHVGALRKEHPDAPFAVGYFRRADGRWQFALRSGPDFDVSEVAKHFGGGGHAGAAGFDVPELPWGAK